MRKQMLMDMVGWGFILWFIGYVLGVIVFFLVPPALIGWVLMPIGIAITLWVLLKVIGDYGLHYFLAIAVCWTVIAIVFDYFFIVKALNPPDGYYKLDVYLYYIFTLTLPVFAGIWKGGKKSEAR